ncbi:CBS domain-containing protein [bacterium]|nr:CBS domain-containing protein [bacterium]
MSPRNSIQLLAVMTPSPVTADPEMTVQQALELMRRKKIHHLPVVAAAGEIHPVLLGLISQRDLLHVTSVFIGTKAEDRKDQATLDVHLKGCMKKTVYTLPPTATVRETLRLMLDKDIGCVPVTGPGKTLLGIVTVKDLLRVLDDLIF